MKKIISVLGAGTTIALAVPLAQPVVASTNPCGAGYVFRASMPIDSRWYDRGDPQTIKPVGTVSAYSNGPHKCAILTINPRWKDASRIAELLLQMSWRSKPGVGWKDAFGVWWTGKEQNATFGLVAGPIKASLPHGCARLAALVFMKNQHITYVPSLNGSVCV